MPLFGRHSRKSSKEASQHRKQDKAEKAEPPPKEPKPKDKESREKERPKQHTRTKTAPETPSLLRLPSSSSTVSASPRSRRATVTVPSTPTATAPYTPSSATSQSYFSPQQPEPAPAGKEKEPRSPPATRRPPASFSVGHDTSRGPPVTLITRGNSDYARRTPQKPADYAYAQQQFQQLGLVSPGASQHQQHQSTRQRRDAPENSSEVTPQPPTQQTNPPRRNSTTTTAAAASKASAVARAAQHMASSVDESSDDDSSSGPPSTHEDRRAAHSGHEATDTSGTDGEQNEDLFLNIAEDDAPKQRPADTLSRHDKLRSRIGRINRLSSPSALHSPSPGPSSSATPTVTRIPSTTESRANTQRRVSHVPTSSRTLLERPPQSPASPFETPRARPLELSTKASFSRRDSDLSPRDFLAQFTSKRRGSQPETQHTPPNKTGTYRPSNLGHYSSSRDDARTAQPETAQLETASRADGTESHGSTGPAVSVWDELDELKTRIRRIEMGGKIPSTSGAVISQAIAERPRTANTVQINGDSPTIRPSIEPESNTLANISPSRALHRIEARRTSMLTGNANGTHRESSEPYDYERQPSRLQRAGTSLHRNRSSVDDDDEEPTIRAPSRAMTDFRSLRGPEKTRLTGRQYASREPLPDLQPAPTLQSAASLRRPTVTGTSNENSLLFRDGSRRYDFHRESSPAYEKQVAGSLQARNRLAVNRNPNNRNSIGGIADLSNRSVSMGGRMRGNSTGE
ncbi:hypothetical protein FB567DRAFT_448018 [Paraphoma chrysanthemicola]|uniref:Uncharacterized protein n=1 Tax=Paraphoma chrysanthemicola TaxID=798071 RepID=A0A8K0R0H0_9PLEO|nr:hypothetical protein FB567DRAFT_448018 [Paraphoma chrysanthemicola]